MYRRLYEDLPVSRLQLLQRALATIERWDHGALTLAHLVKSDYEETGAVETDSEGVIDHLRAVEGTAVAALVRELLADDREGMRKVSLRATDGSVDVSRDRPRVRRRRAPAGRRLLDRAAVRDLVESFADRCASSSTALGRPRPGSCCTPKPAGVTSHDVVAGSAASLPRGTRSGTPGTLDPFATGLLLVLIGRATRAQRFLMELPKTYRAVARLGWTSDTGDRDGELRDRAHARPARDAHRRADAAPSGVLGGARWAASGSYARARRGEAVELPRAAGDGPPRRAALARRRARRASRSSARPGPTCAR